jgi:asparagine synthase (glutamine-hydrolysing)
MGFSVPLASWLRGPLAQRMRDSVLSPRMLASGYFNVGTLQTLVNQHLGGNHDHSTALWMLVMFDAFLRQAQQTTRAVVTTDPTEVVAA